MPDALDRFAASQPQGDALDRFAAKSETQQPSAADSLIAFKPTATPRSSEELGAMNFAGSQIPKGAVTIPNGTKINYSKAQLLGARDASRNQSRVDTINAYLDELSHPGSSKEAQTSVLGIPTGENVPQGKTPIGMVGRSAEKIGLGLGSYLTSPNGIAQTVASLTPARLLVMAKWAYDMTKGGGEAAGDLSHRLFKPNKTKEDWQAISDDTVNTLVSLLTAGKLGSDVAAGVTGVRAPLTRGLESRPKALAKDVAWQLNRAKPNFTAPILPLLPVEPPPDAAKPPATTAPVPAQPTIVATAVDKAGYEYEKNSNGVWSNKQTGEPVLVKDSEGVRGTDSWHYKDFIDTLERNSKPTPTASPVPTETKVGGVLSDKEAIFQANQSRNEVLDAADKFMDIDNNEDIPASKKSTEKFLVSAKAIESDLQKIYSPPGVQVEARRTSGGSIYITAKFPNGESHQISIRDHSNRAFASEEDSHTIYVKNATPETEHELQEMDASIEEAQDWIVAKNNELKSKQSPSPVPTETKVGEVSPLQKLYQKAKDDFERARKAINAIFPNINVTLIPSGRGGKPVGGDIQISPDGKEIQISQTLLDDIKEKYPDNSDEVLKMAVNEEMIHHGHIKALGDDFESKLADIWNNAPKDVQDAVRKAYGNASGMKAHHWGAELLRMAKQANTLGKTTESIHWNPERQSAAGEAIPILQEWSKTQAKDISDLTGNHSPPSPVPPETKGVDKNAAVNLAASEATRATEAWGKHSVEVVEPLRQKIRKLNQEVQQMAGDATRTLPKTKGKQRLTQKAFLDQYGVSSMEEANTLYKSKNAEWAEKEKELEAAEQKLKELSAAKDKAGQNWSRAVTRSKEQQPAPPEGAKPAGEERILGFGGTEKRVPKDIPIANTQEEVVNLQKTMTPGLEVAANTKHGIQSLLLPTAQSAEHLRAAENLGAKLGASNHRAEAAAAQLKQSSKIFDKLGVHNEDIAPADNPGIKFMSDMSQGRPMAERFQAVGRLVQKLFDERVARLEEIGAPLNTVRENYFPGMWTRESRLAFNAAMEKAKLPEGFDVNTATPEQKAAIKADVDKFLEEGKGSDKDMLSYFTRSPLKGKESFRKQKVFDDIMTAAEFGLRPISYNPIDLVKGKLAEMDKSIMANEFFKQLRDEGRLKIISPYEEVPAGWVRVNDKYGTIYGKPTVNLNEFVDRNVYDGLMRVAKGIGITPERVFSAGRGKLGYASTSGKTVTQFATELSVLAHELGHQLDFKYDLWNKIAGAEKPQGQSPIQKELRALSDLTFEGETPSDYYKQKVRKKAEKMAHMLEAYIHAPDQFQKVAPTVFDKFDKFILSKPELKELADINQGLALKKLSTEKYVGLPIMGYRIVPEATGDIINNYLSSSLYNNKYFGNLYKGWMAGANVLNQSQLGMGSAFHVGFTTGDVQISAGANLIKDIYGVARGNRTPADLAQTAKTWAVSSVKTAMTGDKVLNAWRNPDGVIDPRIAQVVKAAELAGGGFKLEHGMMTEQSTKVMRDWYSGSKIKAAARSPVALTELMAKPIMEYIVPRQKAGVFAELAWRIIEQNPGKDLETLTPQFRQAWNRVDSRLGQVRYNRVFANNTAKNVVQGLVRAPGWTTGTIAEIGGAFPDAAKFMKEWIKTGKMPEDIPDRVAYTMSLLMTVGAINGALTYAFTGQMPKNMDYLAFRTGKKDAQGNDERFLIPSYMKDILSYALHPLTTLTNKAHPLISLLDDVLIKNHDFYGYEIRDPNANVLVQAGQAGKYVVKSFEPFWTRGARKASQQGSGIGRFIAPYFGIMPAPSYITKSKMQADIADLYERRFGGGIKPLSKQKEMEIKSAIRQAEKRGDTATSQKLAQQALESGTLTRKQEQYLFKTANIPADVFMWKRLPESDKEALLEKMTDAEKERYATAAPKFPTWKAPKR